MSIGDARHLVTVETPGDPVPDGGGGYTEGWTAITPAGGWPVAIRPATARDLERVGAGTVIAHATHVIEGRYLPGISVQARIQFQGRTFAIAGVQNVDERGILMRLVAEEQV